MKRAYLNDTMWQIQHMMFTKFGGRGFKRPRYYELFPPYKTTRESQRKGADIISDLIADFDEIAKRAVNQ